LRHRETVGGGAGVADVGGRAGVSRVVVRAGVARLGGGGEQRRQEGEKSHRAIILGRP
jgi:hypothetical protein